MRINDTGLHLPTYSARPKPSAERAPEFEDGLQTTNRRTLERDGSSSGLASNLWQLQTGEYSNKEAARVAAERNNLRAEFQEESNKTPAERIRDRYLEVHGLTEDMLAQLPKEEREAVEDQIQALIKREYGFEDTATEDSSATAFSA